jgi:hypothetical protein
MGWRFQRRIRIAPGVTANLSKSGVGSSLGRNGSRIGVNAKHKKYFSIELPGTGLSYRTILGRPVRAAIVKKVCCAMIAAICLGLLFVLATRPT